MRESFTYLFKDNKWLIKFLTVFVFIGVFTYGSHFYLVRSRNAEFLLPFAFWLPMAIGCLISYIIVLGYRIANIKVFQDLPDNIVLPYINLKANLKAGFKYFCAFVLFHLCWQILLAVCGIMTGLSFATYNRIFINTCCILFLLVSATYLIYWILTEFGYVYMYSENPSFLNFFKFKELFSKIRNHKKQYFLAVGCNILLFLLIMTIYGTINYFLLLLLNPLLMLLINTVLMAIMATYKFFVCNMLIAKSLKDNQSEGE